MYLGSMELVLARHRRGQSRENLDGNLVLARFTPAHPVSVWVNTAASRLGQQQLWQLWQLWHLTANVATES